MRRLSLEGAIGRFFIAGVALALTTVTAVADVRERIRIPVGRSEVVTSNELVRTVAIAEPKIADAAVGSERTIIVNGKSLGTTSLIVYAEGGLFTAYDVEVYQPNADKQVVLHVRVAEVNANAKRELGMDLLGSGILHSTQDGTLSGGFFTSKVTDPGSPDLVGTAADGFAKYTRADLTLQGAWKALEEKGDLRSLANPTLVARSGQSASFLAGGEFPMPVASTGAASGGTAVTIEWKRFGVLVDFKPTVLEDGSIQLEVAPEVSQLNFSQGIEVGGFRIPSLVSRRTMTTVRLDGGEHLVIGGLKQTEKVKTVRRVPVLGQIPLVNLFFSHTASESVDRELLIVVSPEILGNVSSQMPKLPTDTPQKGQ